jgi:hypothetical protein
VAQRELEDEAVAFRIRSLPLACLSGASAALLITSFMPVWTLWQVNALEGVGYHETLWFVLWETARPSAGTPDLPLHRTGDVSNLVVAAVSLILGACVSGGLFCFIAWWRGLRRAGG